MVYLFMQVLVTIELWYMILILMMVLWVDVGEHRLWISFWILYSKKGNAFLYSTFSASYSLTLSFRVGFFYLLNYVSWVWFEFTGNVFPGVRQGKVLYLPLVRVLWATIGISLLKRSNQFCYIFWIFVAHAGWHCVFRGKFYFSKKGF